MTYTVLLCIGIHLIPDEVFQTPSLWGLSKLYMHVNKTFSRTYKSMPAYGSSVLSCEPSSKDFKSLCMFYSIESMHELSK